MLSGTDTASAITFNTSGYTLTGGTALSLSGAATVAATPMPRSIHDLGRGIDLEWVPHSPLAEAIL